MDIRTHPHMCVGVLCVRIALHYKSIKNVPKENNEKLSKYYFIIRFSWGLHTRTSPQLGGHAAHADATGEHGGPDVRRVVGKLHQKRNVLLFVCVVDRQHFLLWNVCNRAGIDRSVSNRVWVPNWVWRSKNRFSLSLTSFARSPPKFRVTQIRCGMCCVQWNMD